MHFFCQVSLDEDSVKKLIVQQHYKEVEELLKKWLSYGFVVGGVMFGCRVVSNWRGLSSLEKSITETRVS